MSEYKNGVIVGGGGDSYSAETVPEVGAAFTPNATDSTVFYIEPSPSTISGYLDLPGLATDYVSIPDSVSLNTMTNITIMASAKISASVGFWANAQLMAKSFWWNGTLAIYGSNYGIAFNYATGKFLGQIYVTNGGVLAYYEVYSTTVHSLPMASWVHTAVTYDGTDLKIYVDGSLEGTTSAPGVIQHEPGPWGNDELNLGAWRENDSNRAYSLDGGLDECVLWSRAISASEVASIYGGVSPTDPLHSTDLVSRWSCDEGTGSVVGDSVGSNNGTYNSAGAPAWGAPAIQNFTLNATTGLTAGQTYYFLCTNGGNRQIVYNSMYEFPGAATGAITTTAGKTDLIKATCSKDGLKLFCTIENNYA